MIIVMIIVIVIVIVIMGKNGVWKYRKGMNGMIDYYDIDDR